MRMKKQALCMNVPFRSGLTVRRWQCLRFPHLVRGIAARRHPCSRDAPPQTRVRKYRTSNQKPKSVEGVDDFSEKFNAHDARTFEHEKVGRQSAALGLASPPETPETRLLLSPSLIAALRTRTDHKASVSARFRMPVYLCSLQNMTVTHLRPFFKRRRRVTTKQPNFPLQHAPLSLLACGLTNYTLQKSFKPPCLRYAKVRLVSLVG
jgi:hypothetical protein